MSEDPIGICTYASVAQWVVEGFLLKREHAPRAPSRALYEATLGEDLAPKTGPAAQAGAVAQWRRDADSML